MIPDRVKGLAGWLADFTVISVTDHVSYSVNPKRNAKKPYNVEAEVSWDKRLTLV